MKDQQKQEVKPQNHEPMDDKELQGIHGGMRELRQLKMCGKNAILFDLYVKKQHK